MKKRTMLCLTAAAVTLSLGAGAMAMAAELPAAGEPTLSLGAENDGVFSTAFDQEGNLLGPSDSASDGNRSYILNTATNCI